ncbi:carbon monoxide dehydrogenase [Haematobacter missouriensis]|uniref:Carbon monoxide dehydrogenase n=1 Tax=Haematobacter missouriensis TaxID=366616 RepID=A0A212ALB2_9RHOB|nr:xanthine dehydrogenase family protein molybdopterin-binding subunit [Haematobacter missouriensis]KFI32471.1 carbon monoxide dehydrogenase [Haematobacter missouriensis]OWJ76457.1 carbon monoxide dehydrogenase [Haematobacter missouriensis]OWJ82271.1 carbon monoxide dehydrogenase [Haematobacter missouriensis]
MQGIAQTAHRIEDRRFLRGEGRYLADIRPEGCTAMVVVRSPHGNARIGGIDTAVALAMPGVLAVLTAADVATAGAKALPCLAEIGKWDWARPVLPSRPLLAADQVRHVGEPVAVVIAETPDMARDAADMVVVDYEPLETCATVEQALAGETSIWPEAPDNIGFDWHSGDAERVADAFARAANVVSVDLHNNRVAGMSLETRGAIGEWDTREERFTLYVSSQGGHAIRRILCQNVFGIPEGRMRVITPDVGGGFGPKIFTYQEYALVLLAAARLNRPVKWVSDRGESLISDTQGRAQTCRAELALDDTGRFLAMRFDCLSDMGAYPGQHGPNIATVAGDGLHPATYDLEAVHVRVRGVFTNTLPTDSYRGAGRPEVIYAVERLVDAAARELGFDPVDLRLRNFVPRGKMPFTTVTGQVYDDGDFAQLTARAVALSDFTGRESLREAARECGKLSGMGLAYFIDRCGRGLDEFAELRFDPSGSAVLLVGSQNNGQGHETAYANIVAQGLGLDRNLIRVVQGDTDQVAFGRGTGGSRALAVGGNAVHLATGRIRAKLEAIAAHLLEGDISALRQEEGRFHLTGTNHSVTLADCVRAAFAPSLLPPGMEPGLSIAAHYRPERPTFPNGCHIARVEIDIETAEIRLTRYVAVNDVGTILNPRLVEGQFHGGLAQGISQALLEEVVYDPETAQPLTGSLMDYCYPKADDFVAFETDFVEIPCRTNPLGVKGCGEAGTIAAPPAIANAVMDALRDYDTEGLQMPFTAPKLFAVLARGPRAAGK